MLTRIAPTPSGYLHLGNAVNFVLTWLVARAAGGRVWLRIDDLDADRKRPEYVADIFETLDWLGLDYDVGPTGPDEFEARWSQRHRMDRYEATLAKLAEAGAVYACGLSRTQWAVLADTDPSALQGQRLPLDVPNVAWRFRAEGLAEADFVVRRRDGLPAYQIASLTDDVDFGVTHLVRGQDLLASTGMQRQLAESLGFDAFLGTLVWHHPLLLDAAGQKLAKSAGSGEAGPTSVRAMRQAEEGPGRVYRAVGTLLHESLGTSADAADSLADLLVLIRATAVAFAAVRTVK